MFTERCTEIFFKGGHAKAPYFRYSLDIVPALENYTRGMARTAAWSVPPPSVKMSMGQRIANELKIVERHSATKANMLKETYIPLATGRLSWEQFVPSARFSEIKLQAAAALENASWLPKKIKDTLIGPLRDPHGMSWRRMGSHIQRYFYSTTLGGKPVKSPEEYASDDCYDNSYNWSGPYPYGSKAGFK